MGWERYIASNHPYMYHVKSEKNLSIYNMSNAIAQAKFDVLPGMIIKIRRATEEYYKDKKGISHRKIQKVPYRVIAAYPNYIFCESLSNGKYHECFLWDEVVRALGLIKSKEYDDNLVGEEHDKRKK